MRPSPWSSAATRCSWAPPSPRRGTPRLWRRRCDTPWRAAAPPTRRAASLGASIETRSALRSDLARDRSRQPTPHRLSRPDAVVVGAGAIGAACAYELAKAGLRVTVIERAAPGAEAAGASTGILSLPDPTRRDALATLWRLSRDLYDPLADASGGGGYQRRPGPHGPSPPVHE